MKAQAWLLVAVLAAGLAARALAWDRLGSGFATLPILTPTSLAYEAAMRAQRGQPAGMGGAEALALAEALLARPPGPDPALAREIEALGADRQALLSLRNRRHALNIRLMDVGVDVVRRLDAEQWAAIHMGRDALRAQAEAASFERLRSQLQGGQ